MSAGWRAAAQPSCGLLVEQPAERVDDAVDRVQLAWCQALEPGGEPGGAPGASGPEDAQAVVGQLEADAAAVDLAARAAHESAVLQAGERGRHRGCADALALRQVAHTDARVRTDDVEQCGLAARDAQRRQLATELAVELEEDGPKAIGDGDRIRDR